MLLLFSLPTTTTSTSISDAAHLSRGAAANLVAGAHLGAQSTRSASAGTLVAAYTNKTVSAQVALASNQLAPIASGAFIQRTPYANTILADSPILYAPLTDVT